MSPSAESLTRRLAANLADLRRRIASACRTAGRSTEDVAIVAVTKTASDDEVRALAELGLADFGENRPQRLTQRADELAHIGGRWHLIGPLQRNKVRGVLPCAALNHSVDSIRLLEQIDRVAGELSHRPRLLLQANVSGESSKGGFSPGELLGAADALARFEHVDIAGLMTMAPLVDEEAPIRATFRGLRELRDQLQEVLPGLRLNELSMGMSHDLEIAIEEGATIVRPGTALLRPDAPA